MSVLESGRAPRALAALTPGHRTLSRQTSTALTQKGCHYECRARPGRSQTLHSTTCQAALGAPYTTQGASWSSPHRRQAGSHGGTATWMSWLHTGPHVWQSQATARKGQQGARTAMTWGNTSRLFKPRLRLSQGLFPQRVQIKRSNMQKCGKSQQEAPSDFQSFPHIKSTGKHSRNLRFQRSPEHSPHTHSHPAVSSLRILQQIHWCS